MKVGEINPKEFYAKYEPFRKPYEDMAKRISEMTLPYVFADTSFSGSSKYKDKIAQSYCGRLVSTLKAKMGMSLLPPSTSSFRFEPNKDALMEITQGNPDMIAETYAIISSATNRVSKEIENQQVRDTLFELIQQKIMVGSVIMEKIKDDGIMLHTLRNFTVRLDNRGEAVAYCIKEIRVFPPEGVEIDENKDEYELYTLCEYDKENDKWIVRQSLDDVEFGSPITYTQKKFPFQYVGWNWTTGDKYHRPYAEDYINDMEQFNQLSELILKGSIISAKTLLMVDPRAGRTNPDDVANSENGDVINGRADDVTVLQVGKQYDFQIAMDRMADIQRNLASAFLMNESVTRDAERVTAQEIRFMAQELETSSLSGVYSKLSKKVSKRIVEWVMDELGMSFKEMSINVVTGLDALGRSQEAQKLDGFTGRVANLGFISYLNEFELMQRYASFDGVDTTGLLKTPSQIQQERQAQMQQQAEMVGAESLMASAGQAIGQS